VGLTASLLAALLCQAPDTSVTIAVEPRVESLRYRFENPSRFDTVELVPHFFEQTYDTDHLWVRATVQFKLSGVGWRIEGGATPAATRRADDFDTFYQPDGNVVTTGTTGNATAQAWALSGRAMMAQWRGVSIGLEYEYRRDRALFHDGDGITTMSRPPTETHRLVTTRETTVSQVHSIGWIGEARRRRGRNVLTLTASATPVALARLTVDLPDKYPGQVLAYHAKVARLEVRARYEWTAGRWGVGGSVRAGRSFNWSKGGQMALRSASVTLDVTRR
jgi:hypothetical protein